MAQTKKNKTGIGDMPHNLEAEQALLGCLLLDTKIQVEVSAYIRKEDFYADADPDRSAACRRNGRSCVFRRKRIRGRIRTL